MKRKIAVIVPVYCESQNLRLLYQQLEAVTAVLTRYDWKYVLVNDGSTDNSLEVLQELARHDSRFKVIDFSRNFGKEIALTAGVCEAGDVDAVICLDADLQHPPELIPRLVKEWEKGTEVVVTRRVKTLGKQPLLRRLGSYIYYWVMSKISDLAIVPHTTDFRLYDKKIILAFKKTTEHSRMFRSIMDWMGFRRVYIEFEAPIRNDGKVAYSYSKLWFLAINSITSFSLWPLQIMGFLGGFITFFSGLLLAWMFGNYLLNSGWGYTPLAIVIVTNTFLGGLLLLAIGLLSIYVGTIHTESMNRPLYVIRERINFDLPSDEGID